MNFQQYTWHEAHNFVIELVGLVLLVVSAIRFVAHELEQLRIKGKDPGPGAPLK